MPKISQLTPATPPLIGNETFIINQAGTTYNTTLSTIGNFAGGGSNVSGLSANWQNTYTSFSTNSANYAKVNVDNNFLSTQTFTTSAINLGQFPLISVKQNSLFAGFLAGNNATNASNSNFLGYRVGNSATYASNSNFLGFQAGYGATNASHSNFLGFLAGNNASDASRSNFLGYQAGYNATNASNSNFLGYQAGYGATNASHSNFLGRYAGYGATNASHSNFIGYKSGYNASLSACIAIGSLSTPTSHNQLVLGSSTYPLSTVDGGNSLVININGTLKKITLNAV